MLELVDNYLDLAPKRRVTENKSRIQLKKCSKKVHEIKDDDDSESDDNIDQKINIVKQLATMLLQKLK